MWVFLNKVFYREALLAPRPTPKLEDHPSSAVRDCLSNLFAATLIIGGRSSIRNLRTRRAVVTGTQGSCWGKPEGRRPLGRPRHRWVDNIRMDLQEVGCGYMDWIGLSQDRDRWRTLVSAVMKLRVPWNSGNFLTSCKPVSFLRRTLHHGVSK